MGTEISVAISDSETATFYEACHWVTQEAARFGANPAPILEWLASYYRAWGNPGQAARMALREFDLWG